MFDRTDVLWRDEPTPEPAHTPARDDAPTDDLARQVTRRPGAPGHHPRSTATDPDDQHTVDGEDRAHRPTEAARARQAREQHRGWQGREARDGRPRAQAEARDVAFAHRKQARAGGDPLTEQRHAQHVPTVEEAAAVVLEQ